MSKIGMWLNIHKIIRAGYMYLQEYLFPFLRHTLLKQNLYAMDLIDGSETKDSQDYSLVVGCESLLFIAISRRKENRDDIFKESGGSDGFSQNPNVIRLCGVVFRRQGLNMWGGF